MENKTNEQQYDVVIIGAGPAGLTCAIYASRGNLKVMFIEKGAPGGKMTSTYKIENWSGEKEIKGYELSLKMFEHAKAFGAKYKFGNVKEIESISEFEHNVFLTNDEVIKTKFIVIATGMVNKVPHSIKGIDDYLYKGVSYCVVCDSSFYKGKPAAIIGGGNSAFEESIYLSSVASEVNIFVNTSQSHAEEIIQDQVKNIKNIKVYYNSNVLELKGENQLEKILVNIDGKEQEMNINHLYPYIGFDPNNSFAKKLPIFNDKGFIIVDNNFETSVKGVYAIGDIIIKQIRQIVTAASDGAIVGKILTSKIK